MSNATYSLEMCFISERGIKQTQLYKLAESWSSVRCFQKTAPTSPSNVLIVQDLSPPHTNHVGEHEGSAAFPTAKRQH